MKAIRTLTCAALLATTLIAGVQAASVETVAGTMQLPSGVQMTTFSKSEMGKLIINQTSMREIGGKINPNFDTSLSKELGTGIDVYQLRGEDENGLKTASVFIFNNKTSGGLIDKNVMKTIAPENPLSIVAVSNLNRQTATIEQLLNEKIKDVLIEEGIDKQYDVHVSLLDIEPITILNSANGAYYWASTRALLTINGFELPFYISAAFIPNNNTPSAVLMITSDVERHYFAPRFKEMLASIE